MPKYLIERDLPGAGELSAGELQTIARKSCDVLQALGPDIQWVQSYVTDDKIYCVYIAPDADIIREHARAAGSRRTGSRRCAPESIRRLRKTRVPSRG